MKIVVYENQDGILDGFETIGHACFADKDEDIVCAGVSALMINFINSIEIFTDDGFKVNSDFTGDLSKDSLSFIFDGDISSESQLLLKSMCLGLEKIAQAYGKEYVELEITRKGR